MKKHLPTFCILLMLVATINISAQNSGDYRSVASGNYTDATTWETFDGTNWVAAASAPGSETVGLITIRSGHTVVLPSGKTGNAYDLMIENGAVFNGGDGVTIASPRSLRIHGSTVTVNGVFGDAAGGTLNLEFNNNITITGTGLFSTSRVRAYAVGYSCTFDIDAKLWYSGGEGTGGYGLQFYKDNTTITVNAGKTITFDTFSGISTGSGGSASGNNCTFNIYGTVITQHSVNMKTSGGKAANVNIYSNGSLSVGNDLSFATTEDGGSATLVLDGTLLTHGTTDYGVAVVSGNGTITHSEALNAPTDYNVGGTGAVLTSAQDLGATTVTVGLNALSTGGINAVNRWFKIDPANNSNLNATLVIKYDEADLNGITEADLRMFKSIDDGNSWILAGGILNETANTVTLTGVNDFSTWTLGDVNSPLPVELTSFSVKVQKEKIILNWQTATEKNNLGWDIERISPKDKNWSKIGFIKGKTNSEELQNYSFLDKVSASGKYQYRIKQIDHDGTFEYSKTVEAIVLTPAKFSLQNYPNPFNPSTTINFDLPAESNVSLIIYNMLGQKITTLVDEVLEAGSYQKTFDAASYSSGLYIYQLTAGNTVITKKMMLTK